MPDPSHAAGRLFGLDDFGSQPKIVESGRGRDPLEDFDPPAPDDPAAALPARARKWVPEKSDVSALLEGLNPEQREAVLHNDGPLLVVAGAGSGKTRVLTHRIARIIAEGTPPWQIMAITFTNKAADEMRRRATALVGRGAEKIWVSTFHSACVRILRRNAPLLGYTGSFTIYDDADSRRLVEQVIGEIGRDPKRFPPRGVLAAISQAKSNLLDATEYGATASEMFERVIAEVFAEYERRLRAANAMDFDDLLSLVVKLFREHGDVLEDYQRRIVHLLVDEYQDTNSAQNELVMMIGRHHRNVCVVGDSDQSIYRFRGADIRNILEFERAFPDATTIVLDQNYRSTQNILDAANAVISANPARQKKTLWSALGPGDKIRKYRAGDERDEATFVANEIATLHRSGRIYSDFAVFYRMNSQSRALEEALADRGVPFKVIGGTGFYERREVRDLLAYPRAVANPADEVSLRRIVNVPKRGVGDASVAKLAEEARRRGVGFAEVMREPEVAGVTGKAAAALRTLVALLEELRSVAVMGDLVDIGEPDLEGSEEEVTGELAAAAGAAGALPHVALAPVALPPIQVGPGGRLEPASLLSSILERTGYTRALEAERTLEAEGRIDNLSELVSVAAEHHTLQSFLQSTALVAATDELEDDSTKVSLMTLHTAKGLEFGVVFLTGMEEELFPHARSLDDPNEIEEERRLCYVGLTRAKERLYLTHTWTRTVFGMTRDRLASRFLKEIPEGLVEDVSDGGPASVFGSGRGAGSRGASGSGAGARFRSAARPAASTGAEALGLKAGDAVVHARWGEGVIVEVRGEGDKAEATIRFPRQGDKNFLLSATPLKRA